MDDRLAKVEATPCEGGGWLVILHGEVDLSNALDVHGAVEAAIGDDLAPVLDLRDVDYMDSQGIRVVHELARGLADRGGRLTVVAPKTTVAGDVIRLTGTDAVVTLTDRAPGDA